MSTTPLIGANELAEIMHPTLALVILWTAAIVTALAIVGGLVFWFFFDTSTGQVPDYDMISRSRQFVSEIWCLEDDADHEALCEREQRKCFQETRWRRLKSWWRG